MQGAVPGSSGAGNEDEAAVAAYDDVYDFVYVVFCIFFKPENVFLWRMELGAPQKFDISVAHMVRAPQN